MGSVVKRTLCPVNCPRRVSVNVTHHTTEASRLFNGNASNSVICPILQKSVLMYIKLKYDSILSLHCEGKSPNCNKSGSESKGQNIPIDVTNEFSDVAAGKYSKR